MALTVEIIPVFLLAFFVTAFLSWIILVTEEIHHEYSHDHNTNRVHQHHHPVPRIGGVAIVAGVIAGYLYLHWLESEHTLPMGWVGIALLPLFIGGISEDITSRVSALSRMLLTLLSGLVLTIGGGVVLSRSGWNWVDQQLLSQPLFAIVLTTFMVAGVTQSTNIIDGFNGLLTGFSLLALNALGGVIWWVGDYPLLAAVMVLYGALLGFFLFNFPSGKIFAGDGGAYLIGFLIASLSLLLVERNSEVSPWFPLAVMVYPIFEVLFSIYRKQFINRISPFEPDRLHLHILLYRKVSQRLPGVLGNHPNPTTSVLMWGVALVGIIPAMLFWYSSVWLMAGCTLFALFYLLLYRRLVQPKR